ncbi:MAG: hypothetical protein ACKVX9_19010 [Blastocatellia bacterium]
MRRVTRAGQRLRWALVVCLGVVSTSSLTASGLSPGEGIVETFRQGGPVQSGNAAKIEELLRGAGMIILDRSSFTSVGEAQDIWLHWESGAGPQPGQPGDPPAGVFSLVERKAATGALQRQRSPELSPRLMLIAAVDAQNRLIWWGLQPDPRILRAEFPSTATGELAGRELYYEKVDFLTAIPADPSIAELRFYHPRWTGELYQLDMLGAAHIK